MPLRASRLLRTALAAVLFAAAAAAHAQFTLASDASAAPYHSVVHLTASGSTGIIVFFDGRTALSAVTASPQGTAVLGIATLAPGPHTLTAFSATAASNPVSVSIAAAPAPFQLTSDSASVYQSAAISLAAQGLPPKATGTLTWTQDGDPFDTPTLTPGTPLADYQAFGDSITAGFTLSNLTNRYPDLFAAAAGFNYYLNYAVSSAITCDVLASHILPNQLGPTQDSAPLYSLMIGSTDMDNFGTPHGEPNFTACHLAALAWLAIPREYKVLPGDPAATILSGPWSLPPVQSQSQHDPTADTLFNSSGAGAAQFAVTSNGGPLYLWYLLGDHLTGAFTVTLDGVPRGTTYTTNPVNRIGSQFNPDSTGYALLRLPVAPGPHTLRVDIVSGTVGLLAAATAPSPGLASNHPTVLATDLPNQNLAQAAASPATIQQYSADALADVNLLAGDGLDIRTVPTHNYLGSSPAEFYDFAHPSILGHQHLLNAMQAAFPPTSTTPYLTTFPGIPREYPLAKTLGTHTYTAAYSGDATYAPSTASTTVTVVAAGHSVTSLSAPVTVFYAAQPVVATATLFPVTPGAVLSLVEGTQVLATATAPANFSVTSLAPGFHTLNAVYAGDSNSAGSTSPPLRILILENPTTLSLSGAPTSLPYGAPTTLTAQTKPTTATGKVTFIDSYTPNPQATGQAAATQTQTLGQSALAGGVAAFALSTLAPGTHSFTASYVGDLWNSPATSSPGITHIDPIPTTTSLTSTPAPFGESSTFIAHVSPADATGLVTFTDLTANTSVQIALLTGTVTWTTSTLSPGPHNVTATYAGDPAHSASTSAQSVTVIPRDHSITTLAASATSLNAGDSVTLTATLNTASATGTVLFSDLTAGTLGQATLASGAASLALAALPSGTYKITATYGGDPNTLPSSSGALTLQVISRATRTTLTASSSTAPYATAITFTAALLPTATSGLIQFAEIGSLLGTSPLVNGMATFTTATLRPGPHTLTASFAGSAMLDPSSGSASITITPAPSATSLTLAQPTVLAGTPATVNIRIATLASTPTGSVILRSGTTVLATGTLANSTPGAAYLTLSFPTSNAGTFPLVASYSGDPGTAASDTATTYTVLPRIATGALTLSATQVPPLTPITLSAAFTTPATSGPALIPTGSVAFLRGSTLIATMALDATGLATTILPPASIGAYTVTAVYTPTGVFTASPVPAQTLNVTQPLAIAFATPSLSVAIGSGADTTAAYTPLSGFQGAVASQCTTDAAYLTCTTDAPTSLTNSATAHIHLAAARTAASTTASTTPLLLGFLLPLCLLARRRRRRFVPLLILLVCVALNGCATGGTFGHTPAGTHTITLTATAANTPTTATLTVNLN